MFNFTTTTIVNSFVRDVDYKLDPTNGNTYIKNVGTFNRDEILHMSKKDYQEDVPAKSWIEIPLIGIAPTDTSENNDPYKIGDLLRLSIDVELIKSESSLYARPWPTKGKMIYAEAVVKSTNNVDLAEELVNNLNKYMNLVYDKAILKITCDGSEICTEGVEGNQVIKSVVLEKWIDKDSYAGGEWVTIELTDEPQYGTLGFGTYQHLIHNVVLPTYENMRYGSATANTPKLGGKYTQFIFTKVASRDTFGTDAVGQVLQSATQHVFWVESEALNDFENALSGGGEE